jgi:hypothetical protein
VRLPFDHTGELFIGTRQPFFVPERFRPRFYLTREEILNHGHIIGMSGTGKSMFLAHLAHSLLALGYPVVVIDPHADLARLLLAMLVNGGAFSRREAFERIIYLDFPAAEQANRYLPMNILARGDKPSDIASDVKDAFHRAFPELGDAAATFDTLLPDAVELLVHNGLPLTSLFSVLVNDAERKQMLEQEQDEFLIESFSLYESLRTKSDKVQYAGSVLRRARQLTRPEILKYSLCQPTMALDFRRVIANHQCIIVNLAVKNKDAKRLLGSLLTVGIEDAAQARAAIPVDERRGSLHAIIDEIQLFCSRDPATFAEMLSEARKFKVFLWGAHQNWSQLPERMRDAFSNVGVEVTFGLDRVGSEFSAKKVGSVDLSQTKQADADEHELTAFKSVPDQWEEWIETIKDLPVSEAIVSVRKRRRLVASAAEKLHILGHNLHAAASLALVVGVGAVDESAFHVEQAAARHILGGRLGQGVPADHAVKLAFLLAVHTAVGRQANARHRLPALGVAQLGIARGVADQNDFVDSSHISSPPHLFVYAV